MHYVGPGMLTTKSFLTLLTRGVKPCIIRKNFPARISAQGHKSAE